jgi:hypothetical protein
MLLHWPSSLVTTITLPIDKLLLLHNLVSDPLNRYDEIADLAAL